MALATLDQYRNTPGTPPVTDDDALQLLLDDATARVDELTLTAVFTTDAQGLPVDPRVAGALARATVKQAAHQITHLEDSDGIPQGAMTLGPLVLPATTGMEARYSADAVTILRTSGLLGGHVLTSRRAWLAPSHMGEYLAGGDGSGYYGAAE
jgi:hypothetical protein